MKEVLLVFPHANSGVDGPISMNAQNQFTTFKKYKDRFLQGIIKKAQFAIPPYGLMILGSYEHPEIRFKLCDTRFDKLPLDGDWSLVGISVHSGAATRAFEIARMFREKGFRVVLGGPHVSLFPETSKRHADAIVIGESEQIWPILLEDLLKNMLQSVYKAEDFPKLDLVPALNKNWFNVGNYFTTNLIQTSRGCPYYCDFCNVSLMNGRKIRHRRVEHVVKDVETQLKADKRVFFFVDDTINANPNYAIELFQALIPYKIYWVGQATVALGSQPKVLQALADSGCKGLLIGIEGVTDEAYKAHQKQQNSAKTLRYNVKQIRAAGISVYGSMIYGLDGDTLQTAEAIEQFIDEAEIDIPGVNLLRPIPGTTLFQRLAREKRLLFDENDPSAFRYSWAQEIQYRPKNIKLEDFIVSYRRLTRKIYTFENALKRAFNAPAINLAILMFNLAYIHMYGLSRKDLAYQLNYHL